MQGGALYIFAILLGGGFGGVVVCQPSTISNRFDTRGFARIASGVYFLQAIAGIAAPAMAGALFTAQSGYRVSFAICGGLCFLSALALILTCRAKKNV
jgi:predicted MFS family arabinose efflux permease